MPQSVVPGGPVNARLRQKSMARVTNCDSQLSQSALGGNISSLMIAIDQTPDTNSESRRLADNLLARAADGFCASGQGIYRRADRLRKITHDEKDQMEQSIGLHLVETAPRLDRIGEAIQTNSSAEVAPITHESVGCSAGSGVQAFTWPLRAYPGDLSGAHALLADVRQKFSRVQSAFTQLVQTLPTSNS